MSATLKLCATGNVALIVLLDPVVAIAFTPVHMTKVLSINLCTVTWSLRTLPLFCFLEAMIDFFDEF